MSQEYLYCEHCLRWTHVRGKGCADCNREQRAYVQQQRNKTEWQERFPTPEAEKAWWDEQKLQWAQAQQQREAEQLLLRRAFRRLMWRLAAIWVAVAVVVPLIARALN